MISSAFTKKLLFLIACLPGLGLATPLTKAEQWGQWRGPLGNGVATHADPPLTWSEDKNVRWKTPLPGSGNSSPVVWGDRIFLTATIPHGEEQDPPAGHRPGSHDNTLKVRKSLFDVIAIDRRSGKILWQTTVRDQVPHEGHHETGSYASASPITDGEKVYAFFGSNGLYCLDLKGKVLWEKDLGDMHTKHGHGEGSSPALHGETLVVNWDHEGPSFIAAFNKDTGKELWRRERDEPSSWSTPHILMHEGSPQVVISAANRIRSYHLNSGKLLWECGGLSHNVVAGPVSEDGILIAGSSYEKQAMVGIKLTGATGDITGTKQVAWFKRRDTPYVPSLLLYKGLVYYLRHYQGVMTCLDIKTGREIYARARFPGIQNVYSSPVAANDRIYLTAIEGTTIVFSAGADPTILAQNRLDDTINASPALVGKDLILRGSKSLYCLSNSPGN
ncbi:PQQ-binding-like beta-propeller repeat protein [Verrucomicrobiaceae bacterium 227]